MIKMIEQKKYSVPSIQEARKRGRKETNYVSYEFDPKLENFGVGKKYIIKTYGCQGNLADSEKMSGILQRMGYTEVQEESEADVILVNTCAIRENAEQRVFGEIGRLKKYKQTNPHLIIGICGCMPQEEKVTSKIRDDFSHVDIAFGTHNLPNLGEYIYQATTNMTRMIEVFSEEGDIIENIPTYRDHNRKAWVNIMYGCDEFCTYCIVPYTRGKERSRRPDSILEEIKELINEGYAEVTLLGQNVNAYGKDFTDMDYTFANLLDDIRKTDLKRVRFTTSHPRDLDKATMDVMGKGGNIMPHLHLPVQSGSNHILKRMNRKYTKEEYLEKLAYLRTKVPGISITTDIIVGFPGETEEDFQATLDLVREAKFEGAFTFIFSPREGTPAARYPDETDPSVKSERLQRLNELVTVGSLEGNKRFENKIVEVLVEGTSKTDSAILTGYTAHNKLVNFKGDLKYIGEIVKVKITKAYSWHLAGEIVE
jgi:tRNA-2-methylthio-N6-dimethylallyladenosine synthase